MSTRPKLGESLMPSLEFVSQVLLWIVVVVQGIFILALARQIGILHQRYASSGARVMNVGLNIGETAPTLEVQDINNRHVSLGVERGKRTLLFFISTGCSVCGSLMPHLKSLNRSEGKNLEIKLIAFGTAPDAGKKYALEHSLSDGNIPFVISDDLSFRYRVTLAPYGIVVDEAGIIRAKGLVNSYFDLESLLTAEELGVRSIEHFKEREREVQFS